MAMAITMLQSVVRGLIDRKRTGKMRRVRDRVRARRELERIAAAAEITFD